MLDDDIDCDEPDKPRVESVSDSNAEALVPSNDECLMSAPSGYLETHVVRILGGGPIFPHAIAIASTENPLPSSY
jgi:hypothetical protein